MNQRGLSISGHETVISCLSLRQLLRKHIATHFIEMCGIDAITFKEKEKALQVFHILTF